MDLCVMNFVLLIQFQFNWWQKNVTKTAKIHENVIVERFFRVNPVDRFNFNLFLEFIYNASIYLAWATMIDVRAITNTNSLTHKS